MKDKRKAKKQVIGKRVEGSKEKRNKEGKT
jgi:hypothetical protein